MVQPPQVPDVLRRRGLLHLHGQHSPGCHRHACRVVDRLHVCYACMASHAALEANNAANGHACRAMSVIELKTHGKRGEWFHAHLPQPGADVREVTQRVCGVMLQCGGPCLLAVHLERVGQAGRCQQRGRLSGALQVQQRELQEEAAQAKNKYVRKLAEWRPGCRRAPRHGVLAAKS